MKTIALVARYEFVCETSLNFFLAAAKKNAFTPPCDQSVAGHGWVLPNQISKTEDGFCCQYALAERELSKQAIDAFVEEYQRNNQTKLSKSEMKELQSRIELEKRCTMPYLTKNLICIVSLKHQCIWVLSQSSTLLERVAKYTRGLLLGETLPIERRALTDGGDVLSSWFNQPNTLPSGFSPGVNARFKINNRTHVANYLEPDDVTPKGEIISIDLVYENLFSTTLNSTGTMTKVNFLDDSLFAWYERADAADAEEVIDTGYRVVLDAFESARQAIRQSQAATNEQAAS